MSIGVSVRTTKFAARNPDVRREHRGSTGKQPSIKYHTLLYIKTSDMKTKLSTFLILILISSRLLVN
jgi:hypothetical protein